MSIENLKKILESERVKLAHEFRCNSDIINEDYGSFNDYQYGSKAMENRLLPLLQKAVEMVIFVDLNTSLCPEHRRNQDIPFCSYNDCDIKIKAREFLADFTKMTEIKKESV